MKPETVPDRNHSVSSIYRALEDIWCGPSTKIMDQVWACHLDEDKNQLGQLFYTPSPENGSEKGLLLAYCWKSDALQFGALALDAVIQEAVGENIIRLGIQLLKLDGIDNS